MLSSSFVIFTWKVLYALNVFLSQVKADRFLHGPTTLSATEYVSSDEILDATSAFHNAVKDYAPTALPNVLNSSTALSALRDLSPGGRLMTKASRQQLGGAGGAALFSEEVKQVKTFQYIV